MECFFSGIMIYFQLSRFTYGSKIVFRSVKTMFYFFWAQKAVSQTAWVIALHWLWYINVVPNSDRFYHSFYWDHISFSYSEVIAPHILAFENVSFHGHLYRPQTKLRKGNVFTPVCKSFWSQGGGVYPSMHGGRHTPWADSPWANTPLQTPHLPSACWDTHPHCPVHGWNTCPPPGGHCCRRYASIWNAFLYKVFLDVIKDVFCSVHLALILNFYSRWCQFKELHL